MPQVVLRSLLGQSAAATFTSQRWGCEFARGKVSAPLMRMLKRELLEFDVPSLVRRSGDIAVWFRTLDGSYRDARQVAPENALAFYDAGHTLYLHRAHTPKLRTWHERLAAELGHPAQSLIFSLFAGRKTAGTQCHFDSLENFTIQLRGHKRWRLAPNKHVEAPIEAWVTRGPVTPRMQLHASRGLPARMPRGAQEVELHAGDVLYVPRGWWHETDTGGDSLAAFVGFASTTWADLVLAALRTRLQREPKWRHNLIASWDSPNYRSAAHDQLQAKLASLARHAADLTVDEIAPELRASPAYDGNGLRRNQLASLQLADTEDGIVSLTVRVHRGVLETDRRFRVDARFLPLLQALQRLEGNLAQQALAKRFPDLDLAAIDEVVRALAEVGYLI